MTQPNLLNLAKQGDTRALTSLLNRSLQARGIVAKATKRNDTLHILLEAATPPSQAASVRCIQQGLEKLGLVHAPVTIYGRQTGDTSIAWQEHLTAPINNDVQSEFFESELLDDSDGPIPTGGEPTEVSEDWSDQATAIESAAPLVPPPPPGVPTSRSAGGDLQQETQSGNDDSWDSFDLQEKPSVDVLEEMPLSETTGFEAPDNSWGAGMPVDYSPEDPEPTLIVPDEGDEDLDASLNDEDTDSEILLSLWDDANLAEDELDMSGDVSVDNLQLWQEGDGEGSSGQRNLPDQPMLVGEPSADDRQGDRKGSGAVPLVLLLGLLAMIGGVVTAARLGAFNPPWLANIPGVGPLVSPSSKSASSQEDASDSSDAEQRNAVTQSSSTVPARSESSSSETQSGTQKEGETTDTTSVGNSSGKVEPAISETSNPDQAPLSSSEPTGSSETEVPSAGPEETNSNTSGKDSRSSNGNQETPPTAVEANTTIPTFDPFREAVNAAQTAANLTQTASTPDEWSSVADYWFIAVENMQAVPKNHPRYDTAQQKVPEYRKNLTYAEQFF